MIPSAAMADVSVVILNWNGWRDTLRCLDSVAALRVQPSRIIVCDNGSTDESVSKILAWAERRWPDRVIPSLDAESPLNPALASAPVVLISLRENRGYAAGNNPGICLALNARSDFVWLLNNDTVVYPEALGALLECAAACPQAGILGSTVLSADDPRRLECAGGCRYNPITTVFTPYHAGKDLRQVTDLPEPSMAYVYGAALFARAEVFRSAGVLNEAYFLFYEELDFCRRARKAGFALGWCRASRVIHKGGGSLVRPGEDRGENRALATYHETLSTFIYTLGFHAFLLPWVLVFRFVGKMFFLCKRRETSLLRAVMAAYRDFLYRFCSKAMAEGPRRSSAEHSFESQGRKRIPSQNLICGRP